MKSNLKYLVLLSGFFILFYAGVTAQNETTKWYFGVNAGLDFSTSPPTILTNTTMNTGYGCATIADASGNLLFYTNGQTVWNQNHAVMANGTGLNGNAFADQSSIIIKQPGSSTIYYIFTTGSFSSLNYSIVDMSLAAGLGSVTVLNTPLMQVNQSRFSYKISAVLHCNGTDVWVLARDGGWNGVNGYLPANFQAFLVTTSGVSTTPVTSPANNWWTNNSGPIYDYGCMKISPNGKKVGVAICNRASFELYDFNATTGVVSNSLALYTNTNIANWGNAVLYPVYGCEFSPDGSKFYGSTPYDWYFSTNVSVMQWNLCAGSDSAIIASQYTISSIGSFSYNASGSLQLGSDGKIYVARTNQNSLDVISNPNQLGTACNYSPNAQSIAPSIMGYGLPNFMVSYFAPLAPPNVLSPFTYTVNYAVSCITATFTAPNPTLSCPALSDSVVSVVWLFGDAASGAANTSTLTNPIHNYPAPGNYTAQLVYNYECGSDTLVQPVTINGPLININTASITCANLGSATVVPTGGIGPFSYTWMPTGQTSSVATGLSPGNYSIIVVDNGGNCTFTSTATFVSLVPFMGVVNNSSSVSCNGATTGTANIPVWGGSGNNNYFWFNGVSTQTTATVNNLGAGLHTITVIDAITSCSVVQFFQINQPPLLNLSIVASTPTACAGSSISFTASNSGGTPGSGAGYTYSWTNNGSSSATNVVSEANAGSYVYSINSLDANNCLASQSIAVNFIANPTLTVLSASICPLQTATLYAGGASSFTWNGVSGSSTFTDNPLATSVYSVSGSLFGCSASTTASIVLKPVPVPTLSSNSPVCNTTILNIAAIGGTSYLWAGPNAFTSAIQNPSINPVALPNAGSYQLTVTAVNGCTASASTSVVVYPSPTLIAMGSTVCIGETFSLSANSSSNASYLWSGPSSFTSALQNPILVNGTNAMAGSYSITATDVLGCSSRTVVNVNVVPPPLLNVSLSGNSTLCAQALNGSPNTITLTSSGAAVYTLSTENHLYNGNPSGPISSLSTVPPFQNSVTISTATLQGSNGVCTVSTSVTFTIIPNPTLTINSFTPVICAGQSFTYTSNGANSYTWGPGSPGLTTYTSAVTIASPTVSSVFSVIGGSLGCNSSTQTSSLTVNPLPVLNPSSGSVCIGSAINLSVTGTANNFTWSPNVGLSTTIGSTVSASPSSYQVYNIVGELNTCTTSAQTWVYVLPLPQPSLNVSKNNLCLNDTTTMQGFGAGSNGSYEWKGSEGRNYQNKNITLLVYNMDFTGTYTLVVTDDKGCKSYSTTALNIKPLPTGNLLGNTQGCVPLCTELTFSSNSPSTTATWQYNQQVINPSNKNCFNTVGNHVLSAYLYDAITTCSDIITKNITVYQKPQADFEYTPNKPIEGFDGVNFMCTSKGDMLTNYIWYFSANIPAYNYTGYQADTKSTNYQFDKAGTYAIVLVVKNTWGCLDTAIKNIRVEPDFNIYIPNSFTPNEDDVNEAFQAKGTGIKTFKLLVFDRWGEKVFETNDITKGWDGTFKGQVCKSDLYVWRLQATDINGKAKELNGHVTLYR